MKRLYSVLVVLLFAVQISLAQRTVTGTVYENSIDGIPLPGVSILLKEQPTGGTVSDFDGTFSLSVPAGVNTLIFSFIGYEQTEVELDARENYTVVLKESAAILKEVVVSAVGIEKDKKAVGYSAQSLQSEDIGSSTETNLVDAIGGKVAGVQVTSSSGSPGASSTIVIRGRTSLNNNAPLFVVDGVPIDNSYAGSNFVDHSNRAIDINPDDIENLTVLKGASATALYGVRAANGAVIITTKKGKAGKTVIKLRQSFTFDRVNKLPGQQQLFAQGIEQNGEAVYRGPLESNRSWGPRIDTLRYDGSTDFPFHPDGRIVGQSNPAAGEQRVEAFDNPGDFFQTGVGSTTSLSISGGNEKTRFYLSGSYLEQTGVIPQAEFSRATLKLSGENKITDKLSVSATANYINSGGVRQQRGSNLSGAMLGLMRAPVTFDLSNGVENPAENPEAYRFSDGTQRTYWGAYDNPYWSVNRNRSEDVVNRVIGNTEVKYEILPWLNALARVGLDYYFEERKTYWDNNSNEFGTGVIFNDLYSFRSLNTDILLNAEQKIGENFGAQLSLGHNFLSERSLNDITEGETFVIPEFYDISNVAQVTFTDDLLRRRKITGSFYDLQLSYKNFLYFSTTGRLDWSSTLPAEENPFFYDSYNLSVIFTEILGMATNEFFSYGKFRISYATVGGDAFPYALQTFFTSREAVKAQTAFLQQTTIGNADLRPEQTRSFEVGTDLRFFKNRLGLDVTYYQSLSKDQIIEVPVAFSSGFALAVENAGEIENKGVEVLLNAQPIKRKNFSWDVTVNFAANENTVISLAEGVNDIRFASAGVASTSNRAIPGQPFGVIYGTRWLRNEAGDILVDDAGYPLFDPQDPGIVGDPNPDFTVGIRNGFTFKNLTLSALLDIRRGGDIFNGTVGVMKNLGIHKSTENREEEVIVEGVRQSDGGANDVPIKLDSDYYSRYPFAGVSEENIEDGSWVRLRELNLSFAVPAGVLADGPFTGLSVGLTARNLFLITDYSGVDPETNLAGTSNSFGRDYFNSPNVKSFGVNLNFTF